MDKLREQFSQIYDQYINKIYRFVYLKVNSQETAEDITSKVFLRGWEAFKKAQSPKSKIKNESAFLYQIARNAVVDYYRSKGRTPTMSEADLQIADPSANAHQLAILSSDANKVREAIYKIKKEYQDVIIWHYLEDIPISQIAKLVNRPEGTVRVMLHRGLKELRNTLDVLTS